MRNQASCVQIYPGKWGKFGHDKWLGFSSSLYPFVTKICNFLPLRIVVQTKKNLGQIFIGRTKKYANVSNPSEITPVDGTKYDKCLDGGAMGGFGDTPFSFHFSMFLNSRRIWNVLQGEQVILAPPLLPLQW